jgi:hypothetical protein
VQVCWLASHGSGPACQQSDCHNLAHILTEVTVTEAFTVSCCRSGSSGCPARGSEGLSDKRLSFSSYQAGHVKPYHLLYQSTPFTAFAVGMPWAWQLRPAQMSRLDCQDLSQNTPLAQPGPFGLVHVQQQISPPGSVGASPARSKHTPRRAAAQPTWVCWGHVQPAMLCASVSFRSQHVHGEPSCACWCHACRTQPANLCKPHEEQQQTIPPVSVGASPALSGASRASRPATPHRPPQTHLTASVEASHAVHCSAFMPLAQ